MLMDALTDAYESDIREHVKEASGHWICPGMYVLTNGRQGWVVEAIDEDNDGEGMIKVRICFENRQYLKEGELYTTDFEPARNWHRALFDGC